jgi:putative endonuclease
MDVAINSNGPDRGRVERVLTDPNVPTPKDEAWKLYVLRCADGSLYCGITNHLERRIQQHGNGTGARYTRGRAPVELLASWDCADRSDASKAELAFKKLSRIQKLRRLAEVCGSR